MLEPLLLRLLMSDFALRNPPKNKTTSSGFGLGRRPEGVAMASELPQPKKSWKARRGMEELEGKTWDGRRAGRQDVGWKSWKARRGMEEELEGKTWDGRAGRQDVGWKKSWKARRGMEFGSKIDVNCKMDAHPMQCRVPI